MKDVRKQLNKLLTESATRYGSSAFRLGLVTSGVSDHLPIQIQADMAGRKLRLISWNMLADQHLYNNLMNVSGAKLLNKYINEKGIGVAYQNKMHHFFSELAQYLMKQVVGGEVVITKAILGQFVSLAVQNSLLARSKDPVVAEQRRQAVIKARKELMAIFSDDTHPLAHELKLAIKHSMELIYHIQNGKGALAWRNRVRHLQENRKLLQRLSTSDVIALQECTDPKEVLELLQTHNPNFRMVVHRVNDRTSDQCVLVFDESKLAIDSEVIKTDFSGQKPCLYARFVDLQTKEKCVLGSIHHPGGNHDHIDTIRENLQTLQQGQGYKSFVMGDYNHRADEFRAHADILYPESGTMAGNDYGNNNQAIDGVLTNASSDEVKVKLVKLMRPAVPIKAPFEVKFKEENQFKVLKSIFMHGCRSVLNRADTRDLVASY